MLVGGVGLRRGRMARIVPEIFLLIDVDPAKNRPSGAGPEYLSNLQRVPSGGDDRVRSWFPAGAGTPGPVGGPARGAEREPVPGGGRWHSGEDHLLPRAAGTLSPRRLVGGGA